MLFGGVDGNSFLLVQNSYTYVSNPSMYFTVGLLEWFGQASVGYACHPLSLQFAICPNGAPPTTAAQTVLTLLPSVATVTGKLTTDSFGVGTVSPNGCFQVVGYKATTTSAGVGGGVQLGRDPATNDVGLELCSFGLTTLNPQ